MKLHLDDAQGRNRITSCGVDHVSVNGTRYTQSLLVMAERVEPWPVVGLAGLDATAVAALVELRPEIALIGTGARMAFPELTALRPLIEAGIGYEVMDTGAACRTYGVLSAEGRRVLAALIVP